VREKAKEGLFFFSAFLIVVWLLSFLAPRPVGAAPQVDWQATVAPYVPGFIAIIRGGVLGIAFIAIALFAVATILPVRDWIAERTKKRSKHQERALRINDYRASSTTQADLRELKNLRQDHSLLYSRVSAICDKHLGGNRPATIHGLLGELEFIISRLQEQGSTPSQGAPGSPNWRAIAQLVEWARYEPVPRLRSTRDAFRAIGVTIPEADAQRGGEFNEWVVGMRSMATPSPTVLDASVTDDSTVADADATTDGRGKGDRRLPSRGGEER
jgi:hypothetical protein